MQILFLNERSILLTRPYPTNSRVVISEQTSEYIYSKPTKPIAKRTSWPVSWHTGPCSHIAFQIVLFYIYHAFESSWSLSYIFPDLVTLKVSSNSPIASLTSTEV